MNWPSQNLTLLEAQNPLTNAMSAEGEEYNTSACKASDDKENKEDHEARNPDNKVSYDKLTSASWAGHLSQLNPKNDSSKTSHHKEEDTDAFANKED